MLGGAFAVHRGAHPSAAHAGRQAVVTRRHERSLRSYAGPRVVVDGHARELARLTLTHAQNQEQGDHDESDDEAPPRPTAP